MFPFAFGLVPKQGENLYSSKYSTQLKDYADPNYYSIFPFYTADQNSIKKRIDDFLNGKEDLGTDQFAWCNFGNYINLLRSSMRYYPVENIDADIYKKLFDWGAWLHTVDAGNTDYLDSVEFFWMTDYFFGDVGKYNKSNPPKISGNMVRSWIHHDTLGMMDYTVFEDIAGLQPRTDDKIELWPLGIDYDYFAVDNIRYHDHDLSIVWQNPDKAAVYNGIPTGYTLYIDKQMVMNLNNMTYVIYDPNTGNIEHPASQIDGSVGSKAPIIKLSFAFNGSVKTANNTSLADNKNVVDMFNKAGVDVQHDGENLAMANGTKINKNNL